MTIPEEVPFWVCLVVWHTGGRGGTHFFFWNLGNPLGEKFESCGGKLWILMIIRNASIGNTIPNTSANSPHFSKQEGFLGQTFGCFFLDYCICIDLRLFQHTFGTHP